MKQNAQDIQSQALVKAISGSVMTNYPAIFEGFMEKGIAIEDIKPRENVFTFNAWKALGLVVKKGEHGVKVVTVITGTKKDTEGNEEARRMPRTTTVFHISQTEHLTARAAAKAEATTTH